MQKEMPKLKDERKTWAQQEIEKHKRLEEVLAEGEEIKGKPARYYILKRHTMDELSDAVDVLMETSEGFTYRCAGGPFKIGDSYYMKTRTGIVDNPNPPYWCQAVELVLSDKLLKEETND